MSVRTLNRASNRNLFSTPVGTNAIVPYRPRASVPAAPRPISTPQVIYPRPIQPANRPATESAHIIDAEIVPSPRQPFYRGQQREKGRPVQSDGRPSSQVTRPELHPQLQVNAGAFATIADHWAYQQGIPKERIDEERRAFENVNFLSKNNGWFQPYTSPGVGPRFRIGAEEIEKANRYRARNGLPSVNAYGDELPLPRNPEFPPDVAYDRDPLGGEKPAPAPVQDARDRTPSIPFGYPDRFFENDPDTGRPYTQSQQEGARRTGRPAWHINPDTGNPWGTEDPPQPVPLPFDGFPGGSLTLPARPRPVTVATWEVTWRATAARSRDQSFLDRIGASVRRFVVTSATAPTVELRNMGQTSTAWGPSGFLERLFINGSPVADLGSHLNEGVPPGSPVGTQPNFGRISNSISTAPKDFVVAPGPVDGDSGPEFRPIGSRPYPARPAPFAPQPTRVSPFAPSTPAPLVPYRDPRTRPSPVPGGNPTAPPHTLPQLPPRPLPVPLPKPSPIPDPINPRPLPVPSPRLDPAGRPYPPLSPSQNPAPFTQVERRPEERDKPAPTSTTGGGNRPPVDKCPDPCPPPEEPIEIEYREFVRCLEVPTGLVPEFVIRRISVPKQSANALKSILESQADLLAEQCGSGRGCCWEIEGSEEILLYEGVPNFSGTTVIIPSGISGFIVEFNPAQAAADNTLRNVKRNTNPITEETTFINAAAIYILNANGNVIFRHELWQPRFEWIAPFEWKDSDLILRILPKGGNVSFKVFSSGKSWSRE